MTQDGVKATYQVHTLESGSSSLSPATKFQILFLFSFSEVGASQLLFFIAREFEHLFDW